MAAQLISTQCCITGGGPAGMMLGFLLARAGVDVVVLEKHGDFLRDFRGDTIHPSTLELMRELGLLDEFLKQPHHKVDRVGAQIGDTQVMLADLTRLPTTCKYIAFMPQWDFLNFLAAHGRRYRGFHLMMNAQATDLIFEGEQVTGVRATHEGAEVEIHADLVVAADGRHSTLRERAGFVVEDMGAPMDVLWMRISRKTGDPADAFGHIEAGRFFIMLDRGDYWQCAYVIPKGSAGTLMKQPIAEFRRAILELSPWLGDRVNELKSWDDVKLLTVAVDRLKQWYRPGLLCIGDAADPDLRPEPRDQPGAGRYATAEAALRGEAHPMVSGPAAHPRAGGRHRRPAGAYPHAGGPVKQRREKSGFRVPACSRPRNDGGTGPPSPLSSPCENRYRAGPFGNPLGFLASNLRRRSCPRCPESVPSSSY
jgi:2-polyprenyl-6-methoxyphenol hydroxylase-like FAD-dependent oxidoreductase